MTIQLHVTTTQTQISAAECLKRQQRTGLVSLRDPWPITLTVLLRVRKEEIRGLTVLLISFKQYDRGSRPNLGEGGPLAGEGVGGVL